MYPCARERSSARASLERPARVEGRPRAHPRAIGAWRTGCGLGEGWAQKRALHEGRARADEVCTRVRGTFCRRLPGAPGRRPLMRDVIAAVQNWKTLRTGQLNRHTRYLTFTRAQADNYKPITPSPPMREETASCLRQASKQASSCLRVRAVLFRLSALNTVPVPGTEIRFRFCSICVFKHE